MRILRTWICVPGILGFGFLAAGLSGSDPKNLYSVENVLSVAARFYGNQLYFVIIGADFDLSICVCDLDSGEVKELFYKEQADNQPSDIVIYDNKLILYGGYRVSIYSLEDGSYTVVGEEGKDYYAATGTKIYETVDRRGYRLHSLNGDLIAEGEQEIPGFEEESYTWMYVGSIKETMLFRFDADYKSKIMPGLAAFHTYIVAFNTDTLEWKILWDGVSDYEGI